MEGDGIGERKERRKEGNQDKMLGKVKKIPQGREYMIARRKY